MHAPSAIRRRSASAKARLAAYGLWQLRDYLMDRGTPTIIVGSLFGYLTLAPMLDQREPARAAEWVARFGSEVAARAAMLGELQLPVPAQLLGSLIFLGALFAMNGIVANDRKQGFYRFLFAKPVVAAAVLRAGVPGPLGRFPAS